MTREAGSFLSFAAIGRAQTYKNVAFHILALPMGILGFVYVVTGLSLGVGLAVTVVGIPLLVGVLLGSRWLAGAQRWVAARLLGTSCDARAPRAHRAPRSPVDPASWWSRVRTRLADGPTWRGAAYHLLLLPFGCVSFGLTIGLLAGSLGLLATPLLMTLPRYAEWGWPLESVGIDGMGEAMLVAALGVAIGFVSLHILGALGAGWRRVADALLAM